MADQYIGAYKLGRKLGQGAFGTVYFATHKDNGEEVAIKTIPSSQFKTDKYQAQQIDTEISVLRDLHHPCLNRLVDLIKTEKEIHMVLSYVGGGNLLNLMRNQHGVGLPRQKGFKLFWQIVSALEYCHQRNICHRDIKAENVLLDNDMNAYLADFGMAKMVNGKTFTKCGSPHYMAPEVLKGKYDGKTADIWSLGVLAYGIFSGRLPFNERNISDTIAKAAQGVFQMPSTFPPNLQDLIKRMICVDSQQRISIEQIKQHDYWLSCCEDFSMDVEGCNEGATSATGKIGQYLNELPGAILPSEKAALPPVPKTVKRKSEDCIISDVDAVHVNNTEKGKDEVSGHKDKAIPEIGDAGKAQRLPDREDPKNRSKFGFRRKTSHATKEAKEKKEGEEGWFKSVTSKIFGK